MLHLHALHCAVSPIRHSTWHSAMRPASPLEQSAALRQIHLDAHRRLITSPLPVVTLSRRHANLAAPTHNHTRTLQPSSASCRLPLRFAYHRTRSSLPTRLPESVRRALPSRPRRRPWPVSARSGMQYQIKWIKSVHETGAAERAVSSHLLQLAPVLTRPPASSACLWPLAQISRQAPASCAPGCEWSLPDHCAVQRAVPPR